MTDRKLVCQECNWQGRTSDCLEATNPFGKEGTIHGCPDCKEVECFATACDEDGCWESVTCGTPTPDGYRMTCSKHEPKSDIGRAKSENAEEEKRPIYRGHQYDSLDSEGLSGGKD